MQYKITIPEPCRQNWDNMIPDDTGRYCNNCKKSVIDFTAKNDEEIQQFFIANFNQPVCGRFKNTQIHRIVIDLPQNIFSIKMPMWMQFLVACLIIFGISIFPFETTIAGKSPAAISFYQEEPQIAKTEKKARILKKKKRKRNRIIFDNNIVFPVDWAGVTYGFTVTRQEPPIYSSIWDTDPKSNPAAGTQIGLNNEPIPQKENPRPTPFTPTEFILPSMLLFRKENTEAAMD